MKSKDKIIFSLIALAAFFWLIYLIKSILAPFIISLIITYFLNPLVNHLAMKYRLSRLTATSLILGLFFIALAGVCVVLLPILYSQFIALISTIPYYAQIVANDFYPKIADKLNQFGFSMESDFSQLMANKEIAAQFTNLSKTIIDDILSSSVALMNILSLIFIAPILIFYLLKDWNILLNKVQNYMPRTIVNTSDRIFIEIDRVLSGYVRGQFNVCIVLSLVYAILLSFTGLNFGFLIGFITGLLAFIPYVGMLLGAATAIIITLFQWGFDLSHLMFVSLVFVFGNIIESNFLTPKLIGSKIGIHPVWLIFGLFAFGTLFGFIGILIAVPLTAICGVLVRFFALKYKERFA